METHIKILKDKTYKYRLLMERKHCVCCYRSNCKKYEMKDFGELSLKILKRNIWGNVGDTTRIMAQETVFLCDKHHDIVSFDGVFTEKQKVFLKYLDVELNCEMIRYDYCQCSGKQGDTFITASTDGSGIMGGSEWTFPTSLSGDRWEKVIICENECHYNPFNEDQNNDDMHVFDADEIAFIKDRLF